MEKVTMNTIVELYVRNKPIKHWVIGSKTLEALKHLSDSAGNMLYECKFNTDKETIFGLPYVVQGEEGIIAVKVEENMDSNLLRNLRDKMQSAGVGMFVTSDTDGLFKLKEFIFDEDVVAKKKAGEKAKEIIDCVLKCSEKARQVAEKKVVERDTPRISQCVTVHEFMDGTGIVLLDSRKDINCQGVLVKLLLKQTELKVKYPKYKILINHPVFQHEI